MDKKTTKVAYQRITQASKCLKKVYVAFFWTEIGS
jgi:hypothetical protein